MNGYICVHERSWSRKTNVVLLHMLVKGLVDMIDTSNLHLANYTYQVEN